MRLTLPLTLLLTSACGPGQPDRLSEAAQQIVSGSSTSDYPEVGMLLWGQSLCTATLVGKKTVITAAHCVAPGRKHVFILGENRYDVESITVHPQYSVQPVANDLALVLLKTAPAVTPAAITWQAPPVGHSLTLVGYGQTSEVAVGTAETKRHTTNVVAKLTAMRIYIVGTQQNPGNICDGDSGGPSFAKLGGQIVQVGVHSTKGGICGQQGHDMRLDIYREWIADTADGDVVFATDPSLDTTAPEVSITSPGDGDVVSAQIEVMADVKDASAITTVTLLVDGREVATVQKAPYTFGAQLSDGQHTLTVRATDQANNIGEASISVSLAGKTADPPAPKGIPSGIYGAGCNGPSDCDSGLCAVASPGEEGFCTKTCTEDTPCPVTSACLATGTDDLHVCSAPNNDPIPLAPAIQAELVGGCQLHGRPQPGLLWLLLLAFWVLRPRGSSRTQAFSKTR